MTEKEFYELGIGDIVMNGTGLVYRVLDIRNGTVRVYTEDTDNITKGTANEWKIP